MSPCTTPARTPSRWHRTLLAAALAFASAAATAAPFAITYTGTIGNSDFPEIIAGQTYSVTLVFDNGGNTTLSQTWREPFLTCTIWRMNNARNVVFAQDLVAHPATDVMGSVSTDATGALVDIFSEVSQGAGAPVGTFTASGIALPDPVLWVANNANPIFGDTPGRRVQDAAGNGVQMDVSHWSAPQPFTGPCIVAAPPPVAMVPALDGWTLLLLGLLATGLGVHRLRVGM